MAGLGSTSFLLSVRCRYEGNLATLDGPGQWDITELLLCLLS